MMAYRSLCTSCKYDGHWSKRYPDCPVCGAPVRRATDAEAFELKRREMIHRGCAWWEGKKTAS